MRKQVALVLTTLMLASAVGCANRTSKVTDDANNAESTVGDVVSELADSAASTASDSTEQTSEASGEASSDNAASTDSAVQENSSNEAGSETSSAEAATSYEPEEIVEPEIKAEEVTQPVQEDANKADEAASSEDDGKTTIVFMGDSQFDNARGTGSSIPAYTCALLDNVKYYNLAIGGTAASLERGGDPEPSTMTDTCFVAMCYALAGKVNDTSYLDKYPAAEDLKAVNPAKVDLYVIEYGANDYINGKDLHNADSAYDIHSYKGALNVGVNTLKEISPNAQFLICGPSYCMWYNADGFVIGDSYTVSKGIGTLAEYADICGNFADDEGLVYMDTMYATYFDLKITTVDDYLQDGLHYKEKGRQIYATALAHFIKKALGQDDGELSYMEINDFTYGK